MATKKSILKSTVDIKFLQYFPLVLVYSGMLSLGLGDWQCLCLYLNCSTEADPEVELPRGAASLGAWRSTSNLFAVIAVRVYTLESSNSLFYFSHHEGDHLSSCLHLPHPFGVRSLPVCTKSRTHRYKRSMPRVLSETPGL